LHDTLPPLGRNTLGHHLQVTDADVFAAFCRSIYSDELLAVIRRGALDNDITRERRLADFGADSARSNGARST